jgi:hypothetical protein
LRTVEYNKCACAVSALITIPDSEKRGIVICVEQPQVDVGAVCHVDNLDCKIVRLLLKVKCAQHWISCNGLPPDSEDHDIIYHKCRACNCTGGSECGRKQNSRTTAPILKCFLVERESNARALGILPIDHGGPSALTVPYKYNFGHARCGPPATAAFQGLKIASCTVGKSVGCDVAHEAIDNTSYQIVTSLTAAAALRIPCTQRRLKCEICTPLPGDEAVMMNLEETHQHRQVQVLHENWLASTREFQRIPS